MPSNPQTTIRVRYLDDKRRQRLSRLTHDESEAVDWQQHIEYSLGYPCWIVRSLSRMDAAMDDVARTTIKLTPMEQAMLWERMSGERLSEAERERIMRGDEFHPPTDRPCENRTATQAEAELVDREITNLVTRVDGMTQFVDVDAVNQRWEEIARDLRSARARVRSLMHPADRNDGNERTARQAK